MKNSLTTIFGLLAAIGTFFANNANPTLQTIGQVAQVVGVGVLGIASKDASNKQ